MTQRSGVCFALVNVETKSPVAFSRRGWCFLPPTTDLQFSSTKARRADIIIETI